MVNGIGNKIIGIFFGTHVLEKCKFVRMSVFPINIMVMISNRFCDFRINLLEKIHFSVAVEISE